MQPDCSVILPAYNCATFIKDSVEGILLWFRDRGLNGEVIVVDDGSHDKTYAMVPEAQGVQTLRMPSNRGKGAAVRAGMLNAAGNVRIYTDADLPYGTDPFAPALSAVVDDGYHAAIGDRTLPGSSYHQPALRRRLVSKTATWLIRTFVTDGLYDTQCGLKAFRADVARALFNVTSIDGFAGDVEVVYLLLRHQLRFARIPVVQTRDTPSTIRLTRDSIRAGIDIVALRTGNRRSSLRLPELETSNGKGAEREPQSAP
jgi:glycosyltransferase involved in cell wall biosynthesis